MNLELIKEKKIDELKKVLNEIDIEVIETDIKLHKLHDKDFLPRYNKAIVKITNRTNSIIDNLLLRVERKGSIIGEDNFDVLPIKTYNLQPKETGKYELHIFDPFNEKFNSLTLAVADEKDWEKRTKVDKWLNQASDFSKRLK